MTEIALPTNASAPADNILDCLARVEPGYIEIVQRDGSIDYLLVMDLDLAPGMTVSAGFRLDATNLAADLGTPQFLHKKMQIRHLGDLEHYFQDPLIKKVITELGESYDEKNGALPLIRSVELIRSGRARFQDVSSIYVAFCG